MRSGRIGSRNTLSPPMTKDKASEIVERETLGVSWRDRIAKLSRLIEPEKTAGLIAEGTAEGLNVAQMAKTILPHVTGGIRASAQRLARTEGLRVANESQRDMYEDLGDLMVGTQILASLDENTRPEHAARNGRIHYNDRRKTPTIDTLPILPDEPNCRCFDVPVMKTPDELKEDPELFAEFRTVSGEGIPDPLTFDQWFRDADPGRQKLAVGVRRFNVMKAKLGDSRLPEWTDFIEEDGKLLKLETIQNETDLEAIQRIRKIQKVMDARRENPGPEGHRFRVPQSQKDDPEKVDPEKVDPEKTTPKKTGTKKPAKSTVQSRRKKILERLKNVSREDLRPWRIGGGDPQSEFEDPITKDRIEKVRRVLRKNKTVDGLRKKLISSEASGAIPRAKAKLKLLQRGVKDRSLRPEGEDFWKALDAARKGVEAARQEERDELLKLFKPEEPLGEIKFSGFGTKKDQRKKAAEFLKGLVSIDHLENPDYSDLKTGLKIPVKRKQSPRSWHQATRGLTMYEHATPGEWVHEICHGLERNPRVHELCKGYLHHRTEGEAPINLATKFSGYKIRDREMGRKDELAKGFDGSERSAYYVGKHYPVATEILTMGAQNLYNNPVEFAKTDPEYFNFIVGVLNGDLLD